jgi:hypothetical protein
MDLSREVVPVIGNVDYEEFRWRLAELDRLLRLSGLENEFVQRGLVCWEAEAQRKAEKEGKAIESPDFERLRGCKGCIGRP